MGIRELKIANATPGALYEVTIPEVERPFLWPTLPQQLPDEGVSLLIGSCFWINDDRDGFYSSAVKELVQRERPIFKILMGDQLYADVWAPLPNTIPEGMAQKYERYWGDDTYRDLLAVLPDAHHLRRPRVLERLPAEADPGPAVLGSLPAAGGRHAGRALRRLPELAEPGRQALEHDQRPAGVVLRR